MAVTELHSAINQLANERGIDVNDVYDSLKRALIVAYLKDNKVEEELEEQLSAEISDDGQISIFLEGVDVTPPNFGRIASQTAKNVLLQSVSESARNNLINDFEKQVGQIVQGYLYKIERNGDLYLDLGKIQGVIPYNERIHSEKYMTNKKYKALLKRIDRTGTRPRIILSRNDNAFIEALFEQEVPEIQDGTVRIEKIARESGVRSKIAVSSNNPKIDPSGAAIGQRGIRVQTITNELNGEKIDIINYSDQPERFIAASLSPANVLDIKIDPETNYAYVKVDESQSSLAIGGHGINARLAARLTGYNININGENTSNTIIEPSATEHTDKLGALLNKVNEEDNQNKLELPQIEEEGKLSNSFEEALKKAGEQLSKEANDNEVEIDTVNKEE